MAASGDWREAVSYDSEDEGDDGIDKGIDNIVVGVDDVKRRTQSTFYAHLLSQSISVSQAIEQKTGTKPVTEFLNELKLKTREDFLDMVQAALTKEGGQCSHEDVLKFAIKKENDIFTNTKGITTYRWKIIELFESIMGEIEKSNDPVIQDLKLLKLKPRPDRSEDEYEDGVDDGRDVGRDSRCSEKVAAPEDGNEQVDIFCQDGHLHGTAPCHDDQVNVQPNNDGHLHGIPPGPDVQDPNHGDQLQLQPKQDGHLHGTAPGHDDQVNVQPNNDGHLHGIPPGPDDQVNVQPNNDGHLHGIPPGPDVSYLQVNVQPNNDGHLHGIPPGPDVQDPNHGDQLQLLPKHDGHLHGIPPGPGDQVNVQGDQLPITLMNITNITNNWAMLSMMEEDMASNFIIPSDLAEQVKLRNTRESSFTKTSFCYLLLDPRITQNLPMRVSRYSELELFKIFIAAIFYVGKGSGSRPFTHLQDAIKMQKFKDPNNLQDKYKTIQQIWDDGKGVVVLKVFQNTIANEAYSREAAMIDAVQLENISNAASGTYYGVTADWSSEKKSQFGSFLVYKSFKIFLMEGERQIRQEDFRG